jgi:hypothetical protein
VIVGLTQSFKQAFHNLKLLERFFPMLDFVIVSGRKHSIYLIKKKRGFRLFFFLPFQQRAGVVDISLLFHSTSSVSADLYLLPLSSRIP